MTNIKSETGMDKNYDTSEGERYPHKWGYRDTWFDFANPREVKVEGNRYPVSGYTMPYLIPFVEEVLGIPIRPEDKNEEIENREGRQAAGLKTPD